MLLTEKIKHGVTSESFVMAVLVTRPENRDHSNKHSFLYIKVHGFDPFFSFCFKQSHVRISFS